VVKASALAVLFVAGALLAGAIATRGGAQDTTTATTVEVQTATVTTTEPATTEVRTEVRTETLRQTTTRRVLVPQTLGTTTAESTSGNGTPTWVWVLLGILAVGLVVLIVLLATRRGGGAVPPPERRRRLDGAVGTWASQGWALQSQSADSAVLQRGGELMLVSVDDAGHVSTRPVTGQ
jgi:hypothetical protein